MTSAGHTAGPWSIDRQEPGELWIAGDGRDHPVCMVTAAGFVTERDEADARLIAAAPDLLAALKALELQALQSNVNSPSNEWGREALDLARAAIEKAEGQARPKAEGGADV